MQKLLKQLPKQPKKKLRSLNKAPLLSAKHLYEYESDSVPEHIAISIKDLETCKIVKCTCIRID